MGQPAARRPVRRRPRPGRRRAAAAVRARRGDPDVRHAPELGGRYAALYRGGSYARRAYTERITAQVAELASRYGVGRGARGGPGHRGDRYQRSGKNQRGGTDRRAANASHAAPAPAPEQLTLL